MIRKFKRLFLSGDRIFVSLRALSVVTALAFALIYSKQMGVERRGLLTFVMTTNLVFSILLISGISLHLRNLVRRVDVELVLGGYLTAVMFFSLFTPALNFLVLKSYESIFGSQIPNNLFYVSALYCFFSTLSYGMHDALLLIKSLKIASVMDLGVVFIQIAGYLTLIYVGETSYFVSVLIAISISYLVMVSAIFVLLVYAFNPKLNLSMRFLKKLFFDSSTPTLVNLANQLLERVDKVFLGLQIGTGDLGRFSTSQSVVGVLRFLPDALSKLSIARDKNYLRWKLSSFRTILASLFLAVAMAELASLFTRYLLGQEWVLPALMLLSIAFLEVTRGFHSLVVMNAIRAEAYRGLKRITLSQIVCGLFIQPFAIHFYGLWGSILTSLFIFIGGIYAMRVHINA